jgi:hypothetical protein
MIKLLAVAMLIAVVAVAASPSGECSTQCQLAYKARQADEVSRYDAAIPGCNGDRECLKAQQELHQAKIKRNIEQAQECRMGCPR